MMISVKKVYDDTTNNIINSIIDEWGDIVKAILYVGSWTTKEMSYIIHHNGSVEFLNDIDVLVITNKKIRKHEIKRLRDKVSKRVNDNYTTYEEYSKLGEYYNFYVDIRICTMKDLKQIPPRLKYYDIFNDPKVIYLKNDNVSDVFPKIDIRDIPLSDGLVHLFNRMALLIEWNPYVVTNNTRLTVLILKAYTAIAEALTLFNKTYDTSYLQKAKNLKRTFSRDFPELFQILPELADRVQTYINMKVHFHKYYNMITSDDIVNIWNHAKRDILITTIYLINKIYKTNYNLNTNFDNIIQILSYLEKNYKFIMYDYIRIFLKRKKLQLLTRQMLPLANLYSWGLFFKKYHEVMNKFPLFILTRSFKSTINKDITSFLYLLIFALLASVKCRTPNNIEIDRRYIPIIFKMIQKLNHISSNMQMQAQYPHDIIKRFSEVFRIWELITFEG